MLCPLCTICRYIYIRHIWDSIAQVTELEAKRFIVFIISKPSRRTLLRSMIQLVFYIDGCALTFLRMSVMLLACRDVCIQMLCYRDLQTIFCPRHIHIRTGLGAVCQSSFPQGCQRTLHHTKRTSTESQKRRVFLIRVLSGLSQDFLFD